MTSMSPRDRALGCLRRRRVDRMPLTLDVGASAGIDASYLPIFRRATGAEDPAEYFDYDIRFVKAPLTPTAGVAELARYHGEVPPGTTFDEFGVGHVPVKDFPLGMDLHPMGRFDDPRQIEDYPFPRFAAAPGLARTVEKLHDRGYAVSAAAGSINEWCYYLRGMDEFMVDLALRPAMAAALLDRVTALCRGMAGALAGAGVDILCLYGDMGSQAGLLVGPDTWREHVEPRWRSIIAAARAVNPDAVLFYHSCGAIEPIIPYLADAGFDVLNPVQPESMDPVLIHRRHGDRIALWGGIGMQSTMLNGTPSDVRRAVADLASSWDVGGIVTAAQTMLPDVPWENVAALVEAIRPS